MPLRFGWLDRCDRLRREAMGQVVAGMKKRDAGRKRRAKPMPRPPKRGIDMHPRTAPEDSFPPSG